MRMSVLILGTLFLALSGCMPTERVALPDLVMKSAVPADVLAPCLAMQLGRAFGDQNPDVELGNEGYEIAINAPRGALLGFATVEPRGASGSRVFFYDGDRYSPDHEESGEYPDWGRANTDRAEAAFNACNGMSGTS